MKVALVVSAWDLVPDDGADAEKWLKDRYPLLSRSLWRIPRACWI